MNTLHPATASESEARFRALLGDRRGHPDSRRAVELIDLRLPSGKAGFAQQRVPSDAALALADQLLQATGGDPSTGSSDRAGIWTVTVQTPYDYATENYAADPAAYDAFADAYDAFAADGVSAVFGDPSDWHFAALTPADVA